ncbi:energy transducer TonB [Spirosoma pollinicola]|uniref:TonB C-terminal domain-containing protein n=1 Tax=Spirosoma pollinicola TaxID=2057025 RepID=A0A2K8Z5C0_9BACT|nr:energy transducer TonB [Spirosoma pollinicola]AUD05087.1 hypothetical protein CWM47_26525 [Spirosoma pollinicola]
MKTLLASLVITLFTASLSWAQAAESSLNTDLSFRQALKSIRYPALAHQPERTAKVYVDFVITKEGKVADVKLLKMGSIDNAFIEEVNRLVAQLPTQKSTYAGEYVLPVVFESHNKPGVYQPTVSDRAAFDRTFVQLSHSKALLNELYVAAN